MLSSDTDSSTIKYKGGKMFIVIPESKGDYDTDTLIRLDQFNKIGIIKADDSGELWQIVGYDTNGKKTVLSKHESYHTACLSLDYLIKDLKDSKQLVYYP